MPQLSELDQDQCLALLRAGWFGRFVVQTDQGPLIVPVNYVLRGDTVIARIAWGGVLARCWNVLDSLRTRRVATS